MPERLIERDELAAHPHYGDLAELARIFHHAVIEDEHGTWRWQQNRLMRHLTDGDAAFYEGEGYLGDRMRIYRGSLCLNTLIRDLYGKKFSVEEYAKFYMGIGYSLGGFCEVFGQREVSAWVDDAEGEEDVIEYLLRRYKGSELLL